MVEKLRESIAIDESIADRLTARVIELLNMEPLADLHQARIDIENACIESPQFRDKVEFAIKHATFDIFCSQGAA